MRQTNGKLSKLFNGDLTLIRSSDNVHIYERKLNQHSIFFVMYGGVVLNVRRNRQDAYKAFRRYRPLADSNTAYHIEGY